MNGRRGFPGRGFPCGTKEYDTKKSQEGWLPYEMVSSSPSLAHKARPGPETGKDRQNILRDEWSEYMYDW